MQKKLIAVAVAGLLSGAAFAQTSVTIGGKFDAGYQFKRTANNDSVAGACATGTTAFGTGGSCGGTTTETLGDGAASTSRITVGAKETLSPGWEAGVSLDLRFGTIEEGKNTTTTGGINSNDKKAMYLTTPIGTVQWGVINLGDNFYLAEKPYMVSPKDLEIVKYGIATYRYTALTNRITELRTPTINAGPIGLLFKGQYAFGDQRKSGTSNVDGTNSADAFSGGFEYKVGDIVNGGFDYNKRTPTTSAGSDGFKLWRVYTSVMPVKGLKLAGTYINQSGYGSIGATGLTTGTQFKTGWHDKVINGVISYNLSDKLEIGAEYSVVRDVGSFRNSGKGWMFGGAYFLSKNTYVYAARQKSDWQSNASAYGGKYDGTGTNFTGTASKVDSTYTRVGLVKEF